MMRFSEQAYSKGDALQKLGAKEFAQSSGDGFADRGRR
jgi:hypothetical protein